jgi:hypothetical protein
MFSCRSCVYLCPAPATCITHLMFSVGEKCVFLWERMRSLICAQLHAYWLWSFLRTRRIIRRYVCRTRQGCWSARTQKQMTCLRRVTHSN